MLHVRDLCTACIQHLMIAPRIVYIFYHSIAVRVKYGNNISLHVLAVIENHPTAMPSGGALNYLAI